MPESVFARKLGRTLFGDPVPMRGKQPTAHVQAVYRIGCASTVSQVSHVHKVALSRHYTWLLLLVHVHTILGGLFRLFTFPEETQGQLQLEMQLVC